MHSLYAHLFIHLYFYTNIFIFLLICPTFMVFRKVNLKLMTEEERETYFNRPESLKVRIRLWSNFDVPEVRFILGHKICFQERIANFRSDSYFSYAESFVGKVPGKYSSNIRQLKKNNPN